MSKQKDLIRNTTIFAIAQFGTKFLSFFLVPLYTNVLSTSEYGVADLIGSTGYLLLYIFTLNIASGVLRFVLDSNCNQKGIFSYGIKVTLKGSLILSVCILATDLLNLLDWSTTYYVVLFLYFIVIALYELFSNYLRGINKVHEVAVMGVVNSLTFIVSNILFLLVLRIGINGYFAAMLLGPVAAVIYAMCKSDVTFSDIHNNCDKRTQKEILSYCIPLIFNYLALWINGSLDKFFITALCGVDQNGIYSIASKIPNILAMCYSVFNQAWTLSAIKEFDERDSDGFVGDTYSLFNTLIVCACTVIIVFNVPLAKILYAKDFFEAWKYSSILLIAILFNAFTAFLGCLFSAAKASRLIATTTIISAISNTILNGLLIPTYGPLGAAIATAIAYIVMFSVRYVVIGRYIHFRRSPFKEFFMYFLLIIQVILDHFNNHIYAGQVTIAVIIFIINYKNIRKIADKIIGTVRSRLSYE